ncbi:MAG: protease pro-enzyme activation domain-containing protein [Chthoniobacterales bacterium]
MLKQELYRIGLFSGLLFACIGISRVYAGDDAATTNENPAIGAEVLPIAGVQDLGRRAGSALVDVVVTLRYNHSDDLDRLVEEQSDPSSANYHKYLTTAQFDERFGPTAEQLNSVTSALQKAGFQITQTTSNRVLVYAKATSALVESYFKTEIHTVAQAAGGDRYMNVTPALLPDSLIPLVLAIHVDNLIVAKVGVHRDSITGPIQGPGGGYTPVALANDFNFPVQNGYDGTGHTAAIIIDSNVKTSDLTSFFSYFPITRTGTISREIVSGTGAINSDVDETALDTETIGGLAPGADIILYLIKELSTADINGAANKIVSDNTAEAVNMSFGGDEFKDATFTAAVKAGEAKGITWSASSGDSGSNGGIVSWPAVVPQVISLGGTDISYSGGTYVTDQAWSGSGGGVSSLYAIPKYQKGVSGLASTTTRNVPDLSFPADLVDIFVSGGWVSGEGTSWSSPTYVALQLEINQVKGTRLGYVNPDIYRAFKKSGYTDFYDVTQGSNGEYNAKVGYDNVSGIGSPIGETLATDPNL